MRQSKIDLFAYLSFFIIILVAVLHMFQFTTVWDDAFISFRVVDNWKELGLPVYNPGEIEWVPTTFLWVALLTFISKIINIQLPQLAQWLGGLSAISIFGVFYITRIKNESLLPLAITAVFCAVSPVWAAWPLSGMETSFFSFLITGAVLFFNRYIKEERILDLSVSTILAALAALTRWEAILIFVVIIGFLLIMSKWRSIGAVIAIFGIIVVPFSLYLINKFQTLLPNSYYAKVHGIINLDYGKFYIKDLIKKYWLLLALPFLPLLFIGKNKKQLLSILFITTIILVWMGYVTVVGGDFMPFHRFVAPVWPVIAIWFGMAIGETIKWLFFKWPNHSKKILTSVIVVVCVMVIRMAIPSWNSVDRKMVNEWAKEETHRKYIGQWLASEKQNDTKSIAVKPAGIIPFYSKLRAYDFYSLTSKKAAQSAIFVKKYWVGHQMVNATWVLDQEPDILILDEHLYSKDSVPKNIGDGVVEKQWSQSGKNDLYKEKLAEIRPGLWLKYFKREKNAN